MQLRSGLNQQLFMISYSIWNQLYNFKK